MKLIPLPHANKLLDSGYSLITVDANKAPNCPWKSCQKTALSKTEFEQRYLKPTTALLGYATGFNDIEVIDVDLKIFSSLKEQQEFWSEYLSFLKDNIDEFDKKFVIYKTMKQGYHIIYRCKTITSNTKIAKLKGYKECVIESRGKGGYCVLYENKISELSYHNIQEISKDDREILWSISKTYDYKEDNKIDIPKKSEFIPIEENETTPWDDYNSKHTALDLIQDEFTIVRNVTKSYIIKRHGATSPHSGYVFKDSGCMFLFSTGTQYPNEKLLSPFAIYCHKYHNGNFTKGASDIYAKGYGSRKLKKLEIKENIKIPKPEPIKRVQFPIEIYPKEIQHFILESSKSLGLSVDFMGCSFLWLASTIIGNSMVVEVKSGWKESAVVWIALVGKAGIGKTPSVNQIIDPLKKINVRKQKNFQADMKKYQEYLTLDKKEKELHEEIKEPFSEQFIVGDITLEALIALHEQNPNSVAVFKDELAGWIKDMNKYRAGSDLEFWLSSWSGSPISLNRKTAKSSFVDKPFLPVLGGIQPSIFEEFTTAVNKDNGFVDRLLISYPDLKVNHYNHSYIPYEMLTWYEDFVINFQDLIKVKVVKTTLEGDLDPLIVRFDKNAKKEWVRIHDKITDWQNSDDENEYMKSMLPKQKSYIPRFALLINAIKSFCVTGHDNMLITKESMMDAELVSDYFINMAKLVKQDSQDKKQMKTSAKHMELPFDKFKAMYEADPDLNKSTASELLEVSRKTIYQWIKQINK